MVTASRKCACTEILAVKKQGHYDIGDLRQWAWLKAGPRSASLGSKAKAGDREGVLLLVLPAE